MPSSKIARVINDVIKSDEDDRLYRCLELTNQMKVLLISDVTTDKASAALDVNIGYMSDPVDLPGLAHFCEHMLFLGTEKYPEENEYSKFLSEHGGSCNAFTSGENTNYYFDVAPEHLAPALDRFAQFFIAPLFTTSCTDREVNAVNSENDKNLQIDDWRLYQLERSLCDPTHDFAKFGTGNKDTLDTLPKQRNQDVRTELLKFHSKHYSANIMGISVLGKESLDELSDLVVELFGDVSNKKVTVPEWPTHPLGPNEVKKICRVVPIKDDRSLEVSWPIPDCHPFYKTGPGNYLGHLIGHEGHGSILSELKNNGWVNTLTAGEHRGAKGFSFFKVDVDLTEDGIDHIVDIVTVIFQYISLLRKEGPLEWIFRECQSLSAMRFRFKDKEDPGHYTTSCSASLHDYPYEEVLSADYLTDEYKPDLINMILGKLTPDNIRLIVVGQKFQDDVNLTEKWYGTSYSIELISSESLQTWKNAVFHENLHLPPPNEFIPTDFNLVPRDDQPVTVPIVLKKTKLTRLWYKQDDKFLLPKSCINIEFNSPYAYLDPLSTNLTHMFTILLQDSLTEYSYSADLAGLSYGLHSTIYGLFMMVDGYSDKQNVLLEKLLEKLTCFEVNKQRFDILLENYVRDLRNFNKEQPYHHAMYYLDMLTSEVHWTKEELLEATDEMTLERLQTFIPHLFSQLFVEIIVYGNVTREQANRLADTVERRMTDKYHSRSLLISQKRRFREVQLPDGEGFVYCQTNDVHKSSSLEVYYQCAMRETHSNMLLELFCQIINEPCFDILRTQEQLGYIVFSGVRRSNGVQGFRVVVQSDRAPEYVETRIESFLRVMQSQIESMTEELFAKHVLALATKILEKPKKMMAENSRYVSEISSQHYHFERAEIEVRHLKTLTKEDVLEFFKDRIAHDAPKRHKLSVHIVSTATTATVGDVSTAAELTNGASLQQVTLTGNASNDGLTPNGDLYPEITTKVQLPVYPITQITDVFMFKRDLGLFPLPKPCDYIDSSSSNLCKL